MQSINERKRSIDINKLSKEQADQLGEQLGSAVRGYVDEAIEKANKLLSIYGMKAKMQVVIMGINEEMPKSKKRGRPKKKDANL